MEIITTVRRFRMERESQLVEKIARALSCWHHCALPKRPLRLSCHPDRGRLPADEGSLFTLSPISDRSTQRSSPRHRRRRRHPRPLRSQRMGPHLRRVPRRRPLPREDPPTRFRRLQIPSPRHQRPGRHGRHPALLPANTRSAAAIHARRHFSSGRSFAIHQKIFFG